MNRRIWNGNKEEGGLWEGPRLCEVQVQTDLRRLGVIMKLAQDTRVCRNLVGKAEDQIYQVYIR